MTPHVRLAAIVTMLVCAAATSAPRASETLQVGGPGGAAFHDPCAPGDALIGLNYEAGKDLNTVGTVCQEVHDGKVDGGIYARNTWGKPPERAFYVGDTVRCPTGMTVWRVDASMSAHQTLHQFKFTCRNTQTGETADTGWSSTDGGQGGAPGFADCGANGYATGLAGGYGALIDRLGLICATYTPPAANATPPATKEKPVVIIGAKKKTQSAPAAPLKPGLKVNNGNGSAAGGDDGGGGGEASAATDTTIYDEPEGNDVAYLSAGDPVTIVDCNGDNWCQISKPRRGWVWGDDLQR